MQPTSQALLETIRAIDIAAYAKSRNDLNGKVTRLSPYLTHGFTSVPALFAQLPALTLQDKLAFEFGWREFFHHVWHRSGDAILQDMRPALPAIQYQSLLPDDIREGRTGLAVIDKAVHTLYQTGYLHNHARMWLASYVVHLRKVHWRVAADWLYGHLLDGDLASNHLSWQWVGATFSSKPYLFNAENVAKYAPADWHCPRSALDLSYEELDRIAHSQISITPSPALIGMPEPALTSAPSNDMPLAVIPPNTRVRLVHPWMLDDAGFDGFRLGVIHAPFHQRFPWSARRWDFVLQRMQAVTDGIMIGDLATLKPALHNAAAVASLASFHPGYRELLPQLCTQIEAAPRHFPDPDQACRSFSAFWNKAMAKSTDAPDAPARNWHR
jgi:deoxyribodipyrimidine photo-lyase